MAIFTRLRFCKLWLQELVRSCLGFDTSELKEFGLKLSIVDSTIVTAIDSKTSDFRVHLKLDLLRMRFEQIQATTGKEAESLSRYEYEEGELVLGDRNFAKANELVSLDKAGVYVLVRFSPNHLKVFDESGKAVNWCEYLSLAEGNKRYESWYVFVKNKSGESSGFYVHRYRISKKSFEKAKVRLRRSAQKRGQKLKGETIEYARFVWVITNVPIEKLDSRSVLKLYRVRWQIEMAIKRLKSLLKLKEMKSKAGSEISQVWLLGKLLYALMLQRRHERIFGSDLELGLLENRRQSLWHTWQVLLEPIHTILVATFYWRKGAEVEITDVLKERKRRRQLQKIPREVRHWLKQEKIEMIEINKQESIKTQSLLTLAA